MKPGVIKVIFRTTKLICDRMYFCETSSQCEETLPINDEDKSCDEIIVNCLCAYIFSEKMCGGCRNDPRCHISVFLKLDLNQ